MKELTRQQIDDWAAMYEHEIMSLEGYDDCCIGIMTRLGQEPILCYSGDAIIEKLVQEDGLTYNEAQEHFEFVILGNRLVGDGTPAFHWEMPI